MLIPPFEIENIIRDNQRKVEGMGTIKGSINKLQQEYIYGIIQIGIVYLETD